MIKLIKHSIIMLYKNIKVYIALSITIIISFTLLLGYLILIDSKCYNNNKKIFSVPSGIVLAQQEDDNNKLKMFEKMMKENDLSFEKYDYYSFCVPQLQYGAICSTFVGIPSRLKDVYESRIMVNSSDSSDIINTPQKIKMLYGKDDFFLEKGEAIINISFFESLGLKSSDLPYETEFLLSDDNVDYGRIKLKVVGVCEDGGYASKLHYDEDSNIAGEVRVYVSQNTLNSLNIDSFLEKDYYSFINTNDPEKVIAFENQLGLIKCSAYEAQKEALRQEKVDKSTKNKIAIMLLLVLGINMFGCLSNVIGRRQYEIGIKRAIGASVWEIIIQFLTESICILVIDELISLWLISNIVIAFKYFYWKIEHEIWIFYCSRYSIISFVVAAVSITVIFSVVLAYKATKVEIVSQLKCE